MYLQLALCMFYNVFTASSMHVTMCYNVFTASSMHVTMCYNVFTARSMHVTMCYNVFTASTMQCSIIICQEKTCQSLEIESLYVYFYSLYNYVQ
jgi:hypothetical protein